jgi:predicted CoA-substrate-specific enzyme activase
MNYRIGLDRGAQSIHAAVLDESGSILYIAPYTRHKGRPVEASLKILEEIRSQFPNETFQLAVTGSHNKEVAKQLGAHPVGTVEAQILGAPEEADYIVCIGNSGAKFINTRDLDSSTNSACAAGSGAYLDEMAEKFGLTPAEFSEFALKSRHSAQISSRCTVFADSDVIGHQQKGTPDVEIAGGCVDAIVRGYMQDIARGSIFTGTTSFQEGVALNKAVARKLEEMLSTGKNKSELIIPAFAINGEIVEAPYATGAIGAARALPAEHPVFQFDYSNLKNGENNSSNTCASAKRLKVEKSKIFPDSEPYQFSETGKVDAYLGFDVGSVSTNVIAIDENNNLIARSYVPTAGRPAIAIQQGMEEVYAVVQDRLNVLGAAATGSGRFLAAKFVGADKAVNEITAQAYGVSYFIRSLFPDITHIDVIEIGGQDSKRIKIINGAPVDFNMNKVCAAGTGSFVEKQCVKYGIEVKTEFAPLVMESDCPADLSFRCTVFTGADINTRIQRNEEMKDVLAGVCKALVKNYMSACGGVIPFNGEIIVFTGGTSKNHALVSAFEQYFNKPIYVTPDSDVNGAIGAALWIKEKKELEREE